MQTRQYAGKEIQLDDEGFLADANQWTPDVAQAIADENGIGPLTEEHWTVITFCREDAAKKNGEAPGLRVIAKSSGVPMKALYKLFPKGPGKLAARVAGLPKPKSCV